MIIMETFSKAENVIVRAVAGEDLLIPIQGRLADLQRIYSLNPLAKFIWDMLDGQNTTQSIAAALAGQFDVSREAAEKDVEAFVQELASAGLTVRNMNHD